MEAIRVKLHRDTAIATGLYRMQGVERGQPFAPPFCGCMAAQKRAMGSGDQPVHADQT
jgi:hypothetical protein